MNKIKSVTVTKLFGYEGNDYTVYFLQDMPTFIYGFNGCGKTSLFKLIKAAIEKDFRVLYAMKFSSLKIVYDNDEYLFIAKDSRQEINWAEENNDTLKIYYKWYKLNSEIPIEVSYSLRKTNWNPKSVDFKGKEFEKKLQSTEVNLLLCNEYYYKNTSEVLNFYNDDGKLREKECSLFTEIINNRPEFTDKVLRIDDKTGELEIIMKNVKKKPHIPFEYLSTGEKNLLLLYYHLIFMIPAKMSKNSVYLQLIDEPELSMHPEWLMSFIDNLTFINEQLGRKKENFAYAIITQAPAITYGHNELLVEMRRENGV